MSAPDSPDDLLPGCRSEADILNDPRMHEYLAGYQPMLQELFLKNYARLVRELHDYGQRYDENMTYRLHQYEAAARKHLWEIQHKKLFDLQCRWRAGEAEVPEARLTADFEDWHDDIVTCRVVPPIEENELALYDAFLASIENDPDDVANEGWTHYWFVRQYPDSYIETEDDWDQLLPEWSTFYDLHRGTGRLRQLPDLRGEREQRYLAAWRDEQLAQREPSPPPDPRPTVSTDGPGFDRLARELLHRYEPPALLRHFEARQYLAENDANGDTNELKKALEVLHSAGVALVPIEAHADWRQALIRAAHHHRISQIRLALPNVYDEYCQREMLGIAHTTLRYSRRKHNPHAHAEHLGELVRAGRVLLGEPDNLDF